MKRLVRIDQDYYGEQNFYQMAFYETEGQLSSSNTLSNNHLKSE